MEVPKLVITQTERLRLLAGQIANLHWILDRKYNRGASDYQLDPLRSKINKLLRKYQRGCEYYDCSHQEFQEDDDELFAGFYFNCEDVI